MSPSTPTRMPPQVVAHVCSWVSRAAGVTARLSLGCLALGAALLLAVVFYRLALHPLSRIPGPRLAAVTNGWLAYHVRDGRMLQLGKTLHERYGPAVRVGPNEVWFNSKDAFRLIYSKSPPVLMCYTVLHRLAVYQQLSGTPCLLLASILQVFTSPSQADPLPGPTNGYEKSSFYRT